jgi:parallel beta-helix repeat protein
MKQKNVKITILGTLFIFFILICIFPHISSESSRSNNRDTVYHSGVFGGGPFYSGGTSVMNTLRASGFTTILIWSIHVHEDGTLYLNDELIITEGAYVGNPEWPSQLATLKQNPTSINRIEFSVGAWGCTDFENIQELIESQGTGPDSILYKNFHILKNISNADAIDFDDESNYHVDSTVQFGEMLIDMGFKVTLCPYTFPSFWSSVFSDINDQHPGMVDRVYLQCYAGGAGNNPSTWNNYFTGITVSPGLWCKHGDNCNEGDNPDTVHTKMSNWKETSDIKGGFMWLFDDMQACSEYYTPDEYADAINSVFMTFVDDDADQSWYDANHVKTIQEGINNASEGNVVLVYDGIYYENVIVDKSIELIGENKNFTIIDSNGTGTGISVIADDVYIHGFTIRNAGSTWDDAGIFLESNLISISDMIITSNGYYGIAMKTGHNSTLFNNNIISNQGVGIKIWDDSRNITIEMNNISDNYQHGINSYESNTIQISNNIIINNSQDGINIEQSNNISLTRNQILKNHGEGIELLHAKNNTLINNNIIENHERGLLVQYGCEHNIIKNNDVYSNQLYGIQLYGNGCDFNQICLNTIENNNQYGIIINSDNNTILNNEVLSHNPYGIAITGKDNSIYHNNFFNNSENAIDENNNMWDNGYPSGGNYWDDYTGVDADGDGIGDTPYNISGGNNQDVYPFINQNGWGIIDINQSNFDRGFPIRHALDGDWAAAQSFSPTLNVLTHIEINLRKFGTPEFNLTLELREDHPQGSLLETTLFTPSQTPSNWNWMEIDFNDITINPNIKYFIVCPPAPSGITTSFGYEWGYAFGNQYDDGAFWFTRDGGGLWRDLPTMYEFVFRIYGYN